MTYGTDYGFRCHLITNEEDNGCLVTGNKHFDVGIPAPYDGIFLDTDHTTYARFVFKDLSAKCLAETGSVQNECWSNLAEKFGDTYCEKIIDQETMDNCFEKLASNSGSENPTSPEV